MLRPMRMPSATSRFSPETAHGGIPRPFGVQYRPLTLWVCQGNSLVVQMVIA